MDYSKTITKLGLTAVMIGAVALTACNKDSESEVIVSPVNLAVSSFSLKHDDKNPGIDSIFFSIDLNRGVIFNADSLPKGTNISKLVPQITFGSQVASATIKMEGGTTRTGEVDYRLNPNDSIDFTGDVTLTLGLLDGTTTKSYRIKVNVHNEDGDVLVWDELAKAELPSRLPDPKGQKTVNLGDRAVSLISESDGSYTIATSDNLMDNEWQRRPITFPFTPDLSSLTASDDAAWILDTAGHLYRSADLSAWTDTGEVWESIIGGYITSVAGIRKKAGASVYTLYPKGNFNERAVDGGFPLSERSNFVLLRNKWTSSPVAFLAGGITADGSMSDATWAFDGAEWIKLGNGGIPKLAGASIIPYYVYRRSASGDSMVEYNVWMLLGGALPDGSLNRTVYITYDNGVNWSKGPDAFQLPEAIPAMFNVDNIVMSTERNSNISDSWKIVMRRSRPQRIPYEVDGETITWQCPYIYLIGGYGAGGEFYNTIWRGVLTRLTFTPII